MPFVDDQTPSFPLPTSSKSRRHRICHNKLIVRLEALPAITVSPKPKTPISSSILTFSIYSLPISPTKEGEWKSALTLHNPPTPSSNPGANTLFT